MLYLLIRYLSCLLVYIRDYLIYVNATQKVHILSAKIKILSDWLRIIDYFDAMTIIGIIYRSVFRQNFLAQASRYSYLLYKDRLFAIHPLVPRYRLWVDRVPKLLIDDA